MGVWVFILAVIFLIIFNSKAGQTETSSDNSAWDDISHVLGKAETKSKRGTKPKRPRTQSTSSGLFDCMPLEAKTGSAMADLVPIWEAAGRGKYEIVEEKLAAGADVNEPDSFFGETALHRAAKVGDLKMVQILLGHGAKVDLTDQYGETPLHFAIKGRNPEVIRTLLKHGADPDQEDIFGRSPAKCARFYSELRDCFTGSTPT